MAELTQATRLFQSVQIEAVLFVVVSRFAPRTTDGQNLLRAERQLGLERLKTIKIKIKND